MVAGTQASLCRQAACTVCGLASWFVDCNVSQTQAVARHHAVPYWCKPSCIHDACYASGASVLDCTNMRSVLLSPAYLLGRQHDHSKLMAAVHDAQVAHAAVVLVLGVMALAQAACWPLGPLAAGR
jgi:hypothetical protein